MNIWNLLFVAVVSVLFQSSHAIKCYNCVSKINPECEDPSAHPNFKPQECTLDLLQQVSHDIQSVASEYTKMFGVDIFTKNDQIGTSIVCQKVIASAGSEDVIIRTCHLSGPTDTDSCKIMKKDRTQLIRHCSQCSTDGCNSSNWILPMPLLIILIPALITKVSTLLLA